MLLINKLLYSSKFVYVSDYDEQQLRVACINSIPLLLSMHHTYIMYMKSYGIYVVNDMVFIAYMQPGLKYIILNNTLFRKISTDIMPLLNNARVRHNPYF